MRTQAESATKPCVANFFPQLSALDSNPLGRVIVFSPTRLRVCRKIGAKNEINAKVDPIIVWWFPLPSIVQNDCGDTSGS